MQEHRDNTNTNPAENESRYTIPGASIYSDAYYKKAPQARSCAYGYNPSFSYTQPAPAPAPEKSRHSDLGTVLSACVVCILLAVTLGVIGTVIVLRANSTTETEDSAAQVEALYAELTLLSEEADDETVSILPLTSSEGQTVLTPEQVYAVACQSTVGVTIPGYAQNIFGQSSSSSVSGSGIILSDDGYILTNYHVIADAYENGAQILVITYDETEYTAEIIGVETDSDLAVIKIDATGLTPAILGNSDENRVGQTVYAVGNPLGELTYTMTSGIISALNRLITTDESITVNMFQIDAAVNNGNSGGPVFNAYGQVVGVVTAKYSQSGMEGLGFAIPISDASTIASELITNGYVSGKAYLGLTLTTVSASVAQYYDMVQGVYVYAVEVGSCAEKAGLRTGDIITAIDGTEVTANSGLIDAVKQYRAGETADLTVYRDHEYLTITVEFDEELPAEKLTDEEIVLRANSELPFSLAAGSNKPSGEPASGEPSASPASGEPSGADQTPSEPGMTQTNAATAAPGGNPDASAQQPENNNAGVPDAATAMSGAITPKA